MRARGLRVTALAGPLRLLALVIARRALARDAPCRRALPAGGPFGSGRRVSPKVLAKWGACLMGEVLAKPGSCLGCCRVLGEWVNGCRWRRAKRSRRSTPVSY